MPTPTSNSPFSQAPLPNDTRRSFLALLFLAVSCGVIALLFGLLLWRLMHLAHSGQPAAKHPVAVTRHVATPPQEIVFQPKAEPGEMVEAPPLPITANEEKQQREPDRKIPVLDAPPRLTEALAADRVFEQRLQASEAALRDELRNFPEVRLLRDLDIQKIRTTEAAAQRNIIEVARTELQAAQEVLRTAQAKLAAAQFDLRSGRKSASAYYAEDVPAYEEVTRRYNEAANRFQQAAKRYSREQKQIGFQDAMKRDQQKKERISYETNLRLHEDLKRSAAEAGLGLGSGPDCQLTASTASQVAKISKELRDMGFVTFPGLPFARTINLGAVIGPSSGGVGFSRNRVFVNGRRVRPPEKGKIDKMKGFQTWCDQHHLERMSGTAPTLTQMLQIEDEATRLLLVRELTRCNSDYATTELAVRAIVDLAPAVRRAALAGLLPRPSAQYLPVLLWGLRYPWTPIADHAAVALHALQPQEAAASLVDLLDLPSPSAPVYDARNHQHTVREVVRLNHLRNCLLCHAPSANEKDGLVRGLVPTPGQPLPVQYYESQGGDFVRADITFLRQDFSVNLHEMDAAPWPNEQRYDFVTRVRFAKPEEIAQSTAQPSTYPQREAVLYALRGLTGKDGGISSIRWRELLGLTADKPKSDQKSLKLENITIVPIERARPH